MPYLLKKISSILLVIFLLFSSTCFSTVSAFSSTPKSDAWITNGTVRKISQNGNYVYIGGDFDYVGPQSGPISIFDTSSKTRISPTFNSFDGFYIDDAVSDNNGGFYIVGYFTKIQGVTRNYAAHILANGTIDPNWNASPELTYRANAVEYDSSSNTVFILYEGISAYNGTTGIKDNSWSITIGTTKDMAIDNGYLYLAGGFSNIGAYSRNSLAAININTKAVDAVWNPNVAGTIERISIKNNYIYITGDFTTVNSNVTRNRAAAFNLAGGGRTGTVQSWNPNLNAHGYAILATTNNVYVGGDFTTANSNVTRNHIAKFNSTNGTVDTNFNPNADWQVYAINTNSDETELYVGGQFTNIAGTAHTSLAVLSPENGNLTSWQIAADSDNPVDLIVFKDNKLLVSGPDSIGGYNRNSLARFSNAGIGDTWDAGLDASAKVYAIEFDSQNVYIGGNFTSINNGAYNRVDIAAVKKSDGSAVTDFNLNANNVINTFKRIGTTLYFGGAFTTLKSGAVTRNRLASINLSDYSVSNWNPSANNEVMAMVSDGTYLYVGGGFDTIGGVTHYDAASFLLSTGEVTPWDPDLYDWVNTMDIDPTNHILYLGGWFEQAEGGISRGFGSSYDISGNIPIITSWDPKADDTIYDLKYNSGSNTVILGGDFYSLDNQDRYQAGEVSATSATLTSWDPVTDCTVYSIFLYNTTNYIGGCFSSIGEDTYDNYNFAMFGDGSSPSQPTVQFNTNTLSNNESVTSVNATINLSNSYSDDVTVDYDVTGGSASEPQDFTIAGSTATISAGNTSTNIPITIINDTDSEENETIEITISNPQNATLGSNSTFTYTITNDDSTDENSNENNQDNTENHNPDKPKNFELLNHKIGDEINNDNPEINFKISDQDSDKVGYKIQISKDKDYKNIILEYKKEKKSSSKFTFKVGQDGTYSKGKKGMELDDGKYFIKIKSIDEHNAESKYIKLNSDDKPAFYINTKASEIENLKTDILQNKIKLSWETKKDTIAVVEWGYNKLDNKRGLDIYEKNHTLEMTGLDLQRILNITITVKDKAGNKNIKIYKVENKKLISI